MKKMYKTGFAIIAVMVMTLAAACSGDDSEGVDDNTPSGAYVHAKVDGVQFETVTIQGITSVHASKSGTGAETQILVVGNDLDVNIVGFSTHGISTTGTYELGIENGTAVAVYTDGPNDIDYDTDTCENAEGTLTITHLDDTKIEGTFEFTGKNDDNCSQSKTITEGSFRGIFITE